MGFFEQQDRARRATARLAILYAAALLAIVAAANLFVIPIAMLWLGGAPAGAGLRGLYAAAPAGAYAIVSALMLAIIALGSVEILVRLSLGEAELASLLSGRRVARGTGNDAERRLINVVDEMAIASGLAVPPVYVLTRERGINAFAAGRSPNQAVVVVTRGALEQLTRDELQAVVAHEFSHIINGDIRLNLRAVCALQGIVFLSGIGRFMMRYYSGYGTEEGRRFVHLPLAVIGAGLFALGAVGLLCARVIQAAIAREREHLADACAVQYTRNADGLCNALARIELHAEGSRLLNWHADALGHMLFSENARGWLGGLLATHPPIMERIRRANPHIAPEFYFERQNRRQSDAPAARAPQPEPAKTIVPRRATAVVELIASIGEPSAESLACAAGMLAYLPGAVRDALSTAPGAQAVMLGCILDEEATAKGRQVRALEALGRAELARAADLLAPPLRQLDRAYRLPLVALALPVLRKELDADARGAFLAAMRAAIQADARLTPAEFVLDTILDWNLGPRAKRSGRVRYSQRSELAAECALVLSLLAYAGNPEPAAARAAFEKGAGALGATGLAPVPRDALQLGAVTSALERLSELAPLEKAPVLAGFGEAVAADGNVKLLEHELLRAVAVALECPMPPAIGALDPRLLRKS